MAKREKLNPLTDTPTNKNDITKDFMLEYIKAKGTRSDKDWFKSICQSNIIDKPLPKDKSKTVKTIDLKKVREEFVNRFFPQLNKMTASSYLDEVMKL